MEVNVQPIAVLWVPSTPIDCKYKNSNYKNHHKWLLCNCAWVVPQDSSEQELMYFAWRVKVWKQMKGVGTII